MVHKEGPDTRWATAVLILVILLRCRSMATSALFAWVRGGATSRFLSCAPLHVSIWLYHRRFRPRVRVSVTKTSCGTIAVSLHGSKVIDQGLSGLLNDQDSLLATTAGCQWRSATGSPSNRPRLVHGPSKVREAASRVSRSLWDEASLSDPPRDEASFRGLTGSKEASKQNSRSPFLSDAPPWPLFLPGTLVLTP